MTDTTKMNLDQFVYWAFVELFDNGMNYERRDRVLKVIQALLNNPCLCRAAVREPSDNQKALEQIRLRCNKSRDRYIGAHQLAFEILNILDTMDKPTDGIGPSSLADRVEALEKFVFNPAPELVMSGTFLEMPDDKGTEPLDVKLSREISTAAAEQTENALRKQGVAHRNTLKELLDIAEGRQHGSTTERVLAIQQRLLAHLSGSYSFS